MGPARPPSRLGSSMQQPSSRSINQPPTNPAKPAKRHLEDESQHRPPASASQAKNQTAEAKRRKTEDEYNQQQYGQPASLKQQPIRKVWTMMNKLQLIVFRNAGWLTLTRKTGSLRFWHRHIHIRRHLHLQRIIKQCISLGLCNQASS